MEPIIISPIFLALFAWFLSQYKIPALRLAAATMLLVCGFVAEARITDIMNYDGSFSLLIATFAIMIAFFTIGIIEFKKYFDIVWQSICKKLKK